MVKRYLGVLVVGSTLLTGSALQAHHSLSATYDIRQSGEVTGVITSVKFTNPHGAIEMDVKNDDGSMTSWTMTTGSANTLQSLGFGRDGPNTVVAGDVVTIAFYPARKADAHLGFIRSITLPDQRQIEFEIE